MVFTFDPHPVRLLRPAEAPPPLTWTDRKAELLASLGVDAIIAYPTDEALLQLDAGQFFERIVRRAPSTPGRWSRDQTFSSAVVAAVRSKYWPGANGRRRHPVRDR